MIEAMLDWLQPIDDTECVRLLTRAEDVANENNMSILGSSFLVGLAEHGLAYAFTLNCEVADTKSRFLQTLYPDLVAPSRASYRRALNNVGTFRIFETWATNPNELRPLLFAKLSRLKESYRMGLVKYVEFVGQHGLRDQVIHIPADAQEDASHLAEARALELESREGANR